MEIHEFQKTRWFVRGFNLLLVTGLVLLIAYNCHPMSGWLIGLLVAIGIIILLTGRTWCAYACPVGLTLDLLTALARKL